MMYVQAYSFTIKKHKGFFEKENTCNAMSMEKA